jgi:hypothetical protein
MAALGELHSELAPKEGGILGNRVIDATFMNAVMEFMTKGRGAAPAATAIVTVSNRKAFSADLRSYGEDVVASALEAATDETGLSVAQRGVQISLAGENIPRSMCLAAVGGNNRGEIQTSGEEKAEAVNRPVRLRPQGVDNHR